MGRKPASVRVSIGLFVAAGHTLVKAASHRWAVEELRTEIGYKAGADR